ncbi:MAG: ABC transporter ATP-binding protein [Anaerobacillus sp.]|uniref:ABC transporter ATP-binding protein n=1 Tax=Anaerobacillus sp. TaxID=1872506 RepID=UPI00391B8A3E
MMIRVENLYKYFHVGGKSNPILNNINLVVEKGSWTSIVGLSGTGKSTLLKCLSGLMKPEEGTIHIGEHNIYNLKESSLSDFRRKNVGFIFQDFKLLPHYSVLDNVTLPRIYDEGREVLESKAKLLLKEVGIVEQLFNRLPTNLSGGEKQRVAIARALIATPDVLLCDEPTGNLDIANRDQITNLLLKIKESGQTLIVVTHDEAVADLGDTYYHLKGGVLNEVVMNK